MPFEIIVSEGFANDAFALAKKQFRILKLKLEK